MSLMCTGSLFQSLEPATEKKLSTGLRDLMLTCICNKSMSDQPNPLVYQVSRVEPSLSMIEFIVSRVKRFLGTLTLLAAKLNDLKAQLSLLSAESNDF